MNKSGIIYLAVGRPSIKLGVNELLELDLLFAKAAGKL